MAQSEALLEHGKPGACSCFDQASTSLRRTLAARETARDSIGAETLSRIDQTVAGIEITSTASPSAETREAPDLPVAVVVPAYQAADYLDDCLASVARQIYPTGVVMSSMMVRRMRPRQSQWHGSEKTLVSA